MASAARRALRDAGIPKRTTRSRAFEGVPLKRPCQGAALFFVERFIWRARAESARG